MTISPLALALVLALTAIVSPLLGCQSDAQKRASSKAAAHSPQAREMAALEARMRVLDAHKRGLWQALDEVDARARAQARPAAERPASLAAVKPITLVYTANLHAEREDCGCRANPLGGLARRQTLLEFTDPGAQLADFPWWGGELPAHDAVFVADAGDMFFAQPTLGAQSDELKAQALRQAEAVVDAFNVRPPDAVAVGEQDLALGLEALQGLAKKAEFPLLSANLQNSRGEGLFDGHRVVERAGRKVAFIALTRPRAREPMYYESRELQLLDPEQAYRAELGKLPQGVDVVVLLSNLGFPGTRDLVESLRAQQVRVDVAVVSNTSRLTDRPEWVEGVPVVEPLNRGKHLGRMDIYLSPERSGDGGARFGNAVQDPFVALAAYRQSWSDHVNARIARDRVLQQIARQQELMEAFDKQKPAPAATESPAVPGAIAAQPATREELEGGLQQWQRELEVLERRVSLTADTFSQALGDVGEWRPTPAPGEGADWVDARVVEVKLAIPEAQAVRKRLDKWGLKGHSHH